MFVIRQIFQEMAAEKLRLGLTILAVVWATVCITVMLAAGEGLRQGLIRSSESGNGKLIYLTGGYATKDFGRFSQGEQLKLKPEDIKLIRALPSVKRAEPSALWNANVTHGDKGTWQSPLAVYPSYRELMGFDMAPGGRWFNPMDIKDQRKVIVLGQSAAYLLFSDNDDFNWIDSPKLTSNPVGKTVKVGNEEFTLIGLLKSGSSYIENGIPLDYAVFIPFSTWQRFNPNAAMNAINIEPGKNVDRIVVAQKAKQLVARKYGASMEDDQLIQTQDLLLRQKTMGRFLIGLQSFLGIIGLVTLGVAGIGIANVMYATVKRATRDIGIRMAIGATPGDIKRHYLLQALLTMTIGGVFGLLLTFGLVELLQSLPFDGNVIYDELGKPKPELSTSIVLVVILALGLVGIAAAWFPANRAASIMPLEALQNE
ncbi:ABC transporter permease [uncultured Photobacterium sp.]|uniref:ABC transporter permease n=1 Tax=uncultured Photobacterium sp. TaxID=173973 RepID=UPI0026033450|nr:ABC transporter permease [uncultured Photobacterium sp.]